MNLNKALIVLYCFLILLGVVTILRFNRLKIDRVEYEYIDDEILTTNMLYIPEIVRSYEKVKDIYGRKNILFFRYTENSCSSCINYYLAEILVFQEEIGKDNVWIFPAYPDDRGSRIQLSSELAKYNYRNIPVDSLIIPEYGGELKSYFAYVNNEGDIDMVFIPDKNKFDYLHNFFLEVKKKKQVMNTEFFGNKTALPKIVHPIEY